MIWLALVYPNCTKVNSNYAHDQPDNEFDKLRQTPVGGERTAIQFECIFTPQKHKSQSNYALDEIEDGDSSWCYNLV